MILDLTSEELKAVQALDDSSLMEYPEKPKKTRKRG